ncbi:methionine--tRNA ligase, cytoplasmic [Chelonus insularis]|uniref:methionine--tRNA ligase, cytoplasmic n=1 Tax=Chelonus insularis TaxID=460826 RepID=UPI00158BC115|nr:methionine--tRNA ligase, cytoplasmic [Chelonus insularis]XP_034942517.1 methionine--tRNA ligase, cytoplasmic [Chelonus insularis]
MIIFTNDNNPNVLKLVIVSKVKQHSYTVKNVAPKDSSDKLPFLKLPCGTKIDSVSAAIQYLWSNENQEIDIFVNQWLEWDSTQLQPTLIAFGSSGSYDNSHKPKVWSLLNNLNLRLSSNKFLVENDLTTADVSIWVTLWMTVAATDIINKIQTEFNYIEEWMKNMEQLSIVQETLNEFKIERGFKSLLSMNAVSWFPVNSYNYEKTRKLTNNEENQSNASKEKELEIITPQEIESIKKQWDSPTPLSMIQPPHTVLPKKGERNILITSALPYVNNVPHLGNIIGCVLSADIFARYCRQKNYNTLYISGTDEYGTATEAKAFQEKMTPKEICDKYFDIHNDIYRWFNIGFDYFGRTTTTEQTEIVQNMFLKIKSEGYILTDSIDQLFCESCQKFLADRFVEGLCPRCKYPDARGDQCDGCGHLVNATELINPRCKICSKTPIIRSSTQFFLDLPKIESKLRNWASEVKKGWSSVARSVAKPWLRDGLKPRCITRDLKWGIPVPLENYRNKVFYVWFDAPLGYISITKKYTDQYEQWWKPENDVNVNLYQFMAKDNVPFHAIMFPATLLAANQNHVLVKHIMATEYLNYEDTKFSKSRGTGVFGNDAKETNIPADVWRFYLAYIRPETQDSNFNWLDLATKVNSELLNTFGNFVNRALVFLENNFASQIPEIKLRDEDVNLLALIQRELTQYNASMEEAKMRDALRHILTISKLGNQYMQSQQPWVQIKGNDNDKQNAKTVIGLSCNLVCLLSSLIAPFMPNISRNLRSQLGIDASTYGYIPEKVSILLSSGHKVGKPSPLFTKIDEKQVEQLRIKYSGQQQNEIDQKSESCPEHDISSLESLIMKQGNIVRELKKKEPKTVWQPQVKILLDLKEKLSNLQKKK